ncbi:MAG: hypothetical protein JNM85_11190 [Chthonomonas sp.]|nr:hypothetical protein [Chthonomonas sp.]
MTSLLLAAALSPFAYGFSPTVPLEYKMAVQFDGFLPIFGGNEGKVEVAMTVPVTVLKSDKAEEFKVQSEISAAEIKFNDAPLPLGVESVQGYFPKTTITTSPLGKTLTTDAPNVNVPIKLPGLDVKRFPELTYIPVEFSPESKKVGESWTYSRDFGGSDVTYKCTVESATADKVVIVISVGQTYTVLEDDSLQSVKDKAEAVNEVTTRVEGSGKATFDPKLGVFRAVKVTAVASSAGTVLKTGTKFSRKLTTTLDVQLSKPAAKGTEEVPDRSGEVTWWDRARGAYEGAQVAVKPALQSTTAYLRTWSLKLLQQLFGGTR